MPLLSSVGGSLALFFPCVRSNGALYPWPSYLKRTWEIPRVPLGRLKEKSGTSSTPPLSREELQIDAPSLLLLKKCQEVCSLCLS